MSQGYFPLGASSKEGERAKYNRPSYMTVGSGPASESAKRLATMLDNDSGYGGSIADSDSMSQGWHPGLTEDRPIPMPLPGRLGENNVECEISQACLPEDSNVYLHSGQREANNGEPCASTPLQPQSDCSRSCNNSYHGRSHQTPGSQ